jgi:hypothetical protein
MVPINCHHSRRQSTRLGSCPNWATDTRDLNRAGHHERRRPPCRSDPRTTRRTVSRVGPTNPPTLPAPPRQLRTVVRNPPRPATTEPGLAPIAPGAYTVTHDERVQAEGSTPSRRSTTRHWRHQRPGRARGKLARLAVPRNRDSLPRRLSARELLAYTGPRLYRLGDADGLRRSGRIRLQRTDSELYRHRGNDNGATPSSTMHSQPQKPGGARPSVGTPRSARRTSPSVDGNRRPAARAATEPTRS